MVKYKIDLITLFINKLKDKYNILIEYNYDLEDDEYYIYHNSYELELNDEFNNYSGRLIREIFRNNGFVNCNFSYNYDFEIANIYTLNNQAPYNSPIEVIENSEVLSADTYVTGVDISCSKGDFPILGIETDNKNISVDIVPNINIFKCNTQKYSIGNLDNVA